MYKKILYFLFILFFVLNINTSFTEAASTSTDFVTLSGSPTTQPNNSQGGFTYKTLVNIPGLGENGVVTISPNSLGLYLQVIFNYIIGAAIALAVVMIMWGGLTYATTDAIGKKEEGKKIIKDALYGLALALGSFLILNTINPDLLKFDLALPQLTATKTQDGTLANIAAGRLEVVTNLQNGVSTNGGAQACQVVNTTLRLGGLDTSYASKRLSELTEMELSKLQTGIQKQEGSSRAGVTNNPGNIKYQSGITSCRDSGVKALDGGTFISCDSMAAYNKVERDIIAGYKTKFPGITVSQTITKWKGSGDCVS